MEESEKQRDGDSNTETAPAHESFDGEEDSKVVVQRGPLNNLLPKLDSSEEDEGEANDECKKEISCSNEEIMREVKKIKRQNRVTHSLLSAMIVLTLAWQLSEVSLILRIKDGFNHPFKSVAGIVRAILKKPTEEVNNNVQEIINNAAAASGLRQQEEFAQATTSSSRQGLEEFPELPYIEFGGFEEW